MDFDLLIMVGAIIAVLASLVHQSAVSVIQPTFTYPIADVSHSNLCIILAAIM